MLHEVEASYAEEGLKAPIPVRPRITVLARARSKSDESGFIPYTGNTRLQVTISICSKSNVIINHVIAWYLFLPTHKEDSNIGHVI
jgi:hypothetical protein